MKNKMKCFIEICGQKIEYELTRKDVKNINLRVRRDGSVAVSSSYNVPQKLIDDFLCSNVERIMKMINRNAERKERENRSAEITFADGDTVCLLGKKYSVQNVCGERDLAVINEESGVFLIESTSPKNETLRRRIALSFMENLVRDTVCSACNRIYPYYGKRGVRYPEIRFRKMISQWGNCRPDRGVLTFNTRLYGVSPRCIELIVAHEFTHFLCRDHSSNFYAELAKVMPDYAERKKELREYEKILLNSSE